MEEEDDGDLKFHRASAWAIREIKENLTLVLNDVESNKDRVPDIRKFQHISAQLNFFQEDPQLLDPHLKDILPRLVSGFVKLVHTGSVTETLKGLAEIFYVFCKVRGQKVITRFLNNEPKHLEPMMRLLMKDIDATRSNASENKALQSLSTTPNETFADTSNQGLLSWELRYTLMLWIAYLMQTPFDLSTISNVPQTKSLLFIELSENLPGIAIEVIHLAMRYLGAPTKDQNAAAATLVKLTLRPDMRKLEVLESLMQWSLVSLAGNNGSSELASTTNGSLLFLSGLVSAADVNDILVFLPAIYEIVNRLFNSESNTWEALKQSAISRKLAIKIQRNIVTHLLGANKSATKDSDLTAEKLLFTDGILENTIDFLLQSLSDRETVIRYAASKALSVITSKMDTEIAQDVIEAVVEAFSEDILFNGPSKDLTAANPSRWHGLTLALSHMLFRRSPSSNQLPQVLGALYNTLTFEQRSTTGGSIGANVRDAANFGLWSLSRRYTTKELLAVDMSAEVSKVESISPIQLSACHLVVAACLDPAGNVRRGSSAALQELIGRHPDTVLEGIALVQTVDYHAVGLRGRAMIDVTAAASALGEIYRLALLEGLFGWRGVQASDVVSRNFAATSIGRLTNLDRSENIIAHIDEIIKQLTGVPPKEVEWRSGLMMALAEVIDGRQRDLEAQIRQSSDSRIGTDSQVKELIALSRLWHLFDSEGPLASHHMDLISLSSKSHLTRRAILILMTSISACCLCAVDSAEIEHSFQSPGPAAIELFTQCLFTDDMSTLQAVPSACTRLGLVLTPKELFEIAHKWVVEMKTVTSKRSFGVLTALAAIWAVLPSDNANKTATADTRNQIINILINTASAQNIETRVIAIRDITVIVDSISSNTVLDSSTAEKILETIETALNDYTINERGDVGSLVRLEAITAVEHVWAKKLGETSPRRSVCYRAVQRLALERLDKVRLAAARCMARITGVEESSMPTLPDISSYTYFLAASDSLLTQPTPTPSDHLENHIAFLEGISSSTGAGSESLAQSSRAALHDILSNTPLQPLNPLTPALHTLLLRSPQNDRLLLPLLDTLSHLLNTSLLPPLLHAPLTPLTFLSLLQKSHFKSTSQPKLLAAVNVYVALADVEVVRPLVLKKLVQMLGGSVFPKVRVAVAEALWVLTGEEGLKGVRWAGPVGGNRGVVEGLRGRLCGEA